MQGKAKVKTQMTGILPPSNPTNLLDQLDCEVPFKPRERGLKRIHDKRYTTAPCGVVWSVCLGRRRMSAEESANEGR